MRHSVSTGQVRSSFAGTERRPDDEKAAGNTLCIFKVFEEVWTFFCPSKPCVSLSTEGMYKSSHNVGKLYHQLTRTHTVLTGRKTPMLLQSPWQYTKYCLRTFHCLNAFLLRQNCLHLTVMDFLRDFWFLRRRRADARQGEKDKKHRKDALSGVCALAN